MYIALLTFLLLSLGCVNYVAFPTTLAWMIAILLFLLVWLRIPNFYFSSDHLWWSNDYFKFLTYFYSTLAMTTILPTNVFRVECYLVHVFSAIEVVSPCSIFSSFTINCALPFRIYTDLSNFWLISIRTPFFQDI